VGLQAPKSPKLAITGRPALSAACLPVSLLHLLSGQKMGFSPCRDDTGERAALTRQISLLSGQKCGNAAPKTEKIGSLSSGATRLDNFYKIPSICVRLFVAFKFLILSLSGDTQPSYKDFPAVGTLSDKFSIVPRAKILIGSKKVRGGAKIARTSSITMPSMVGIVANTPAVNEKV